MRVRARIWLLTSRTILAITFAVLLSTAASTEPGTQESAWEILLRIDAPRFASGLLPALQHEERAVRQKAAEVIGYYRRDESTYRELRRLASDDPINSVKAMASTALEQINFARQMEVHRVAQ
jgi:HEAT repeat protein